MNKLVIIGNLTRDPETRQTKDGKTVCNFTVAVNRRQKDENGKSVADFFRVNAWSKLGENCQKYLAQGRKVSVVGSVSVHPYTDKNGNAAANLEVFAEDVEFLTPRGDGSNQGDSSAQNTVQPNLTPADPDESLPF